MDVIGITGGVGAGKSWILDVLAQEFGAEIIKADQVAKELEEPGQPGFCRLVELFGTGILGRDGRIDRARFADLIFQNEEMLQKVNEVIHPMTWEEILRRIAASPASFVALEAALFDQVSRHYCSEIWYVDAEEETRIKRLTTGRGYSREKAIAIMRNQPDRDHYLELADFVIDSGISPEWTRKQIENRLRARGPVA